MKRTEIYLDREILICLAKQLNKIPEKEEWQSKLSSKGLKIWKDE